MWYLGTCFSEGLRVLGLMVGFHNLIGFFQAKQFYDTTLTEW